MSGGPYPWSMYRGLWSILPAEPTGPYLKGKIVVITGTTSGVGLETTKLLAKAQPEQLILAVRSIESGEKLLRQCQKLNPGLNGKVLFLDLCDLQSIKDLSKDLRVEFGRVDLLINNAGINPNFDPAPMKTTKDGYERVFQTNVLAPFLTTILLLPLLRNSSDPKVLYSGSDTHHVAPHDMIEKSIKNHENIIRNYNDENKYHNPSRYFESKLLLQMLTRMSIKHFPKEISTINVNPGLAMTNLGRDFHFGFSFKTVYEVVWFLLNARSPKRAARNLTSAVVWNGGSQDYWSECKPAFSENTYLYSGNGILATEQFYQEMRQEVEKLSPGCTSEI
ncbi:uncharacterized protein L201_000939 [Kwoniella dendrophila CBS 6074]|uniref:Uncharacterized protein n=1 Tax=Kwoniella dendrophila CBS 6074 TaxID=1295534 RepID=A0AAX4JNR4_9TREE